MGSSKNQTVQLENSNALTTGYGTAAGTGWVSKPMIARNLKEVSLNLDYQGAGDDLSLRLEISSKARIDADPDDYDISNKVVSGAISVDEVTKTTTGNERFSINIDVEAAEVIRVAAKGAAGVGTIDAEVCGELAHPSGPDFDLFQLT